jgi:RND superfamily putative drug exporter
MPNSPLHRVVVGLTRASIRHRRFVLAGWVLFVIGCVAAGGTVGTRTLTDAQQGSGSAARGLQTLLSAGLTEPATESVLVEGRNRAGVLHAAAAVQKRLRAVHAATHVRGPAGNPALVAQDGRDALIELDLRGTASSSVVGVQRAVAAAGRADPSVRLIEVGDGTVARAIENGVSNDFHRAELVALPLTLIILVLVFGSVVAAFVPLLLGLTSVAAAIGAVGALSHLIPTTSTAS